MSHPVSVVFAKEVRDNIRDRRSLLTALVYPLLGPLLFSVMLALVAGSLSAGKVTASMKPLPVVNAADAPELVRFLTEKGMRLAPAPADPDKAVRQAKAEAVLSLPPGFEADLKAGRRPAVTVISDASRLSGEVYVSRVADLLADYGRSVAARQLAERGLSGELLEPLLINNVVVQKRGKVADLFLFMVPPFLMFTLFIGGVYLAIDSTSGERERGSLEPLLANPVPRWQFMLGKFLAACLFTLVALLLQMGGFFAAFGSVDPELFSPQARFGLERAVLLALVALPLLFLAVSLQIIIAALTRSFKEAQTWLGLLPLLPALPGMAMVFMPVSVQGWMMLLPVFSQTVVMGSVVRGEAVEPFYLLLSVVVTFGVTALLLRHAARLFEREEMVFGAS